MGNIVFPDEFGNDCLACFPPGKTPLKMVCSTTGIKAGNLWVPIDGAPANGTWHLQQIAPCWYINTFGPYDISFVIDVPGSSLHLTGNLLRDHFNGWNAASCKYWFSNLLDTPVGNHFYGGQAQVVFVPLGASPSVAHIMELINMERDTKTKCDPIPTAGGNLQLRLANTLRSDNILIEYSQP